MKVNSHYLIYEKGQKQVIPLEYEVFFKDLHDLAIAEQRDEFTVLFEKIKERSKNGGLMTSFKPDGSTSFFLLLQLFAGGITCLLHY